MSRESWEEPLLPLSPSSLPPPISRKKLTQQIIHAAVPQATAVLCRLSCDMTSIAILGHLGTAQLAGSAFAGVVTAISSVVLWQGFGDALIGLSSQAVGAGNPKLSSVWLQTSLLCVTICAIPVAAVWLFTEDILRLSATTRTYCTGQASCEHRVTRP